jgi:hypothetical protein
VVSYNSDAESESDLALPAPSLTYSESDGYNSESDDYTSDGSRRETPKGFYALPPFSTGDGPNDVATTISWGQPFTIHEDSTATATVNATVTADHPEQSFNRLPLSEETDYSDTETVILETPAAPSAPQTYAGSRLSPVRPRSPTPTAAFVASVAVGSSLASSSPGFRENSEQLSDNDGPVNDENAPPPKANSESSGRGGGKRRMSSSSSSFSSRDSGSSPSQRPDPPTKPLEGLKEPLYKKPRQ